MEVEELVEEVEEEEVEEVEEEVEGQAMITFMALRIQDQSLNKVKNRKRSQIIVVQCSGWNQWLGSH